MAGSYVPARPTLQPNISSRTSGGQVPVRQTTEGDRGGDLNSRGCTSPLGNTTSNDRGNQSPVQERRERPY